jgi:uridine kinase
MRNDLSSVVDHVSGQNPGHTVRVAVDGITASGKTTTAAALVSALRNRGRPVIALSMDGFHHPRVHRHRRGRLSPDGYYLDAYDFDALIEHVLMPLGPNGSGYYREAVIDLATDTPLEAPRSKAPSQAVLVVDGTFLQRPGPNMHWDSTVFVDTDFDTARARGITRDAESFGGADAAGQAFDLRYHAACRRYLDEVDPKSASDFVVHNNT